MAPPSSESVPLSSIASVVLPLTCMARVVAGGIGAAVPVPFDTNGFKESEFAAVFVVAPEERDVAAGVIKVMSGCTVTFAVTPAATVVSRAMAVVVSGVMAVVVATMTAMVVLATVLSIEEVVVGLLTMMLDVLVV